MYKTVLVREMIKDGRKLLKALDDRGVPVRAAAWFDNPDRMAWKLVIVSSVASTPGPLEAYLQIQQAMAGLNLGILLDDIIVMSPSSQKFRDFKRTIEGVAQGSFLHQKAVPKVWLLTMPTSIAGWRSRLTGLAFGGRAGRAGRALRIMTALAQCRKGPGFCSRLALCKTTANAKFCT